ncbi:MAG TPA: hypothetical protein VGG25_25675 [Streptosporangiaceae bacterium]|jgi:hypothetical protein
MEDENGVREPGRDCQPAQTGEPLQDAPAQPDFPPGQPGSGTGLWDLSRLGERWTDDQVSDQSEPNESGPGQSATDQPETGQAETGQDTETPVETVTAGTGVSEPRPMAGTSQPGAGQPEADQAGLARADMPPAGVVPGGAVPGGAVPTGAVPGGVMAGQAEGGQVRPAAVRAPETGEARVDATMRLLDDLTEMPVTEHPAVFEQVHARLTEVLDELGSGPLAGPLAGPAGRGGR